MNGEGVCKTALATLGLLNTMLVFAIRKNNDRPGVPKAVLQTALSLND